MLKLCIECDSEFNTFNYKTKYCGECYDKILRKAIKELEKSWLKHSSPK